MWKFQISVLYLEYNIDDISNVESETFWIAMPNIGSFWISW